ncbi:hypothetical protein [Arthrobacter crystallopoietes]|uniref:hypothetical protein n=1 Tax=Crystallibacter crystallopoietes TaxID=37928 RepID=UPI0013053835|nr:hypothetical protein [Arthrobacter crystallopoietes]
MDAATTADRLKEAEVKLSTTLGKAWKKQFQKRDGLFIPWHSLASLRDCLHKGNHPSHAESFVICAPEHLGEPERHNFTMKVGGSLGVHPSTPSSWIEKANVAVCVPSPMAADAWLTQSLFNSGISRDELARSGGQNPARRLTAIMEMVPFEDRVLVLSTDALALHRPSLPDDLAGAELPSEVLLVFDPQHASLTKAHQEASSVWEALEHNPSVSSPRALFLPPLVSRSLFPDGNLRHLLGSGARLDELFSASVLEMPTAPSSNEETKPGAWRISEDGLRTEQCVQSARNDEAPTLRWEERIPLGGRITKLLTRRRPTTRELKTGRMDAPANGKVFINVEVSWEYRGSPEETCQVTGPKEILHYQPVDWIRHGAQIPTELLMHPNWPPRHQHAEGFLQAVKVHRRDERRESMVWQQMGWVPTAHGLPAFIAGEQVIPAHEDVTVEIKTPSPETSLLYGFGEISELNWKDAADVEQVRKDFRTILDTYVRSEAWSDPAAAAVILAGALRPCLPLRPKTSIYVWGPKGRGKTFSAETAMYFWASDKSAWIGKPPGSAGDTLAYTEKVLSSVPIWVIDDLAPSTSRDAAQNKSAHLEDTIRNVFNNAAKGRSDRDAQAQERNFPIAQLIITGENQLTTPSARERTIPVHIGTGSLHPDHKRTAAITELAASDGTQARFTSHVISYIRHLASTEGL